MSVNRNVGMTSLNKTRSTEWMLSVLAFGWGVTLLQPSDLFDALTYKLMREIMRESSWGAIAVTIASLRCLGLAINGWWVRSPLIRALGSFCSGMLWLTICLLMYTASRKYNAFLPAGVTFYPIFFVFEGWCLAAAGYDIQKNGSLNARGG